MHKNERCLGGYSIVKLCNGLPVAPRRALIEAMVATVTRCVAEAVRPPRHVGTWAMPLLQAAGRRVLDWRKGGGDITDSPDRGAD